MKSSRYIITASEGVCSKLAMSLKNHELVIDTFENSGNWYTNGETGPAWFTVTIESYWKNKESIEKLVSDELKKMNASASNSFWG